MINVKLMVTPNNNGEGTIVLEGKYYRSVYPPETPDGYGYTDTGWYVIHTIPMEREDLVKLYGDNIRDSQLSLQPGEDEDRVRERWAEAALKRLGY